MKHFSLLGGDLLPALCDILAIAGRAALAPMQLSVVIMALLAKPLGGFRPIGIVWVVFCVYGETRRELAVARGREHTGPCFCDGAFEGAQDVVWRRALVAEGSASAGDEAAALLADLYTYYELFDLKLLAYR
eukprot:6805542-Pyramimonas_sp.AAC.1